MVKKEKERRCPRINERKSSERIDIRTKNNLFVTIYDFRLIRKGLVFLKSLFLYFKEWPIKRASALFVRSFKERRWRILY